MTTNLDAILGLATELGAANAEAQGDTLPFPAALIQVDSGGGNYLIPLDRLAEFSATADIHTLPPGFDRATVKLGGNRTEAVVAPAIDLAIIGKRTCWESEQGRQLPISLRYELLPVDAGRWVSRTHLLALLLGRNADGWLRWGTVVITARSTQSGKLREAMRGFDTQSRTARRELVGTPSGIPIEAFALPLGFGTDVRVGKGAQTSTIAPIALALDVPAVTADWLRGRVLTPAILAEALDLRRLAEDWLTAWSPARLMGAAPTNGNGNGHEADADLLDDPLPSAPRQTAGPGYSHGL